MTKWKQIKYYPNYEISQDGLVLNRKTGRLIKPEIVNGYERVSLSEAGIRRNFLVHRIVGRAFVPNPERKPEINHKDMNTRNNSSTNLEWVTPEENKAHAHGFLLAKRLLQVG